MTKLPREGSLPFSPFQNRSVSKPHLVYLVTVGRGSTLARSLFDDRESVEMGKGRQIRDYEIHLIIRPFSDVQDFFSIDRIRTIELLKNSPSTRINIVFWIFIFFFFGIEQEISFKI